MLPTCIGISGVSRYRNDASIEDSFLASLMRSLLENSRGALLALLAFRPPLSGAVGQDCACSGGAYAMANGPDRSNWLNWPSACAKRSATTHKAAAFTPNPTWLARCTSIFSAVSEGRCRQVRQLTMPSARE